MIAALELDRRLTAAGQAIAYVVAALPVALLALPALAFLAFGALMTALAVGLPLLIAAAGLCRRLVRLDRRIANRFLGTQIPPVPGGPRTSGSPWHQAHEVLADRGLWRVVGQLALKPPLLVLALAVALAPALWLAAALDLGLLALGGGEPIDYLGPWPFGPGVGLALLALVPAAAVLLVATLEGIRSALRKLCRAVLMPRTVADGPVREMLAESLGDSSVSIVYWLPERQGWVDEVGRPVELPGPGSGRAWTAVERDGHRVAAIVHDAALDTSNELVQAAAAASSMAIDNERLKADLRARLEELRVSRLRIVQAGDEARRRIERDLHDGAQQQLVALALQLRLLKSRLKDPEAGPWVEELIAQLNAALADLRELARGIHPTILSDQGLRPAIDALAARGSVPVISRVAVEDRLPAPVEAAVYFLVAEALTNVSRYANATSARVDVRQERGFVVVEVADDGVGGVDLSAGSGLRGLQDRLAAVGGTLHIESERGRGTLLRGSIPAPATEVAA